MRKKVILASLLMSGAAWAQTAVPPFVMSSPNEYRIVAASPNGRWACGVYADYGDERYGFLWNLESGEIELLNPSSPSVAYGVSNDGVVVGEYSDNTYRSNGASVTLAGYWANHKWNRLEMPTSTVSQSGASSISPDGHYITGHVEENGQYIGYVWKDGKINRVLEAKNGVSMPYAISPDGQYVGGWIMDQNRQACYWGSDGKYTTITDYESPFSSVRKFSPDGKSLLYFGGWEQQGDQYGARAVYDLASGTHKVVVPDTEENFDFFDLSNKGTIMCELGELGYIYQDGKGTYAYKYLKDKGIDLSTHHIFVDPNNTTDSDGNTLYQISRASTVSADDNVMGFQYYNDDKDANGQYSISMQSMVVKFNQATSGLCPVSVKASQLSGQNSVLVAWKPNVMAQGITGYNVFRDGNKVNSAVVTDESFVDSNVSNGSHTYTVSAVYGSTESEKSAEVTTTVAAQKLSTPEGIFTQQHGYNSAYVEWTKPATNFSSLTYYNSEDADIETFGLGTTDVSYETAIRFDKTQVAAYKGQKITSVGFYPLEKQGGWKINLYTYDNAGKLKLLYSQPVTQELNYGSHNVVKLTTPQDLPDGDLIIATEVAVTQASMSINALDYGRAVEGYSDLLRDTSDPDFSSAGQLFQAENYLYEATWIIDATISPVGADLSKDDIKNYNVYTDNKLSGTTNDLSYIVSGLSEGTHTIGVSAVYNNGSESEQSQKQLSVTPDESQLSGVNSVNVNATSETAVKATWKAPEVRDNVELEYCSGAPSNSAVVAPAENNYGIKAGAIYPQKTFRGRNGYVIRAARFYPLSDATFTIDIYKDGELVSETEVNDYTLNKWNEVELTTPVTVDSKSQYQLVVDCYDVTPKSPALAIDCNNPVSGYSDIYSLDGESWNPLSSNGTYANWMIGICLASPTGVSMPIDGYDVKVDGVKKNTQMLTTTSFDYDFGTSDAKEHTISVDAYYTVQPSKAVSGNATRFYLGTTGISDNTIARIEVRQGNNEITVNGDGVTSVDLVSAAGATVASAKGNTVSLDGVSAGVYVVKAVVNGETVTRKIQIEK